jgi:hypothetical protein
VNEPLLGCPEGASGPVTPGAFEVLPRIAELPSPSSLWVSDWSGDGRTAVGWYLVPSDDAPEEAVFARFTTGGEVTVIRRVALGGSKREWPNAVTSCDGSASALVLGQGELFVDGFGLLPALEAPAAHYYLTLSENGTAFSFLTELGGLPSARTEWRTTSGELRTLAIDGVESMSWDGLTTFGTSTCCAPDDVFRWRPLSGEPAELDSDAPSDYVAADGESIPYSIAPDYLAVWRPEGTETFACGAPCSPVAWSSRARVLLVEMSGLYYLHTREHGFRPLEAVFAVPPGWTLWPSFLSLDGRTIAGRGTADGVQYPYFRATLNADALQ